MIKYISILFIIFFGFSCHASHIVGGEISWKCLGTSYVFELTVYRDCNGSDVSVTPVNISVWGHPTLTSISLPFSNRTDLSPTCTQVPGGGTPLLCGVGVGTGNGLGAIEKVIYKSSPIAISGVAPASGWVFTYEDNFRSMNIDNLVAPGSSGTTIVAKMFPITGAIAGCTDNSPRLLQDPYFASCAGDEYRYNGHGVDSDLDSLVFSWGTALNSFAPQVYDGVTIPASIAYVSGYSSTSPTPDISFNVLNSPGQINSSTGEITFTSFGIGTYSAKIFITSYRKGEKIAEVERETEFLLSACVGVNTAPDILAPFPLGSYFTEVLAGDLVNFNIVASDLENLIDGTPQSITFTATGLQFGTNFTSTTGCANLPCATSSLSLPNFVSQQGTLNFNWQTACSHVISPSGSGITFSDYQFVIKVQDNYCPIPKVTYASVVVRVKNRNILGATPITCITGDFTNNFLINWLPVSDPLGTSFFGYSVENTNSGFTGTIGSINSTTYSSAGTASGVTPPTFELSVLSGCGGSLAATSSPLKGILLKLTNPSDGTVILQWNDPVVPKLSTMSNYYHIYREYPVGTFNIIDSVPYGTTYFKDTIDICSAFLNYQIVLKNGSCDFTSNIEGDNFNDLITPNIPIISFATIDTLTNLVTITWNQNQQEDTYGYVVYGLNSSGLYIIDTVWGISNTTFTYATNTGLDALSYSVTAFDSCTTLTNTYQTSGKAEINTTSFVKAVSDPCAKQMTISWSAYAGFGSTVNYTVFVKKQGSNWDEKGNTVDLSFVVEVEIGTNYDIVIRANNTSNSFVSFGNRITHFVKGPASAEFNYLTTATVEGTQIEIKTLLDSGNGVSKITLEKLNKSTNLFEELENVFDPPAATKFIDTEVDVDYDRYSYRIVSYDSCGFVGLISKIATTNVLTASKDEVLNKITLNWTGYSGFNGALVRYELYREVNDVLDPTPIGVFPSNVRFFVDDVSSLANADGQFCYFVLAIEGANVYNFSEYSKSNRICEVLNPVIYIPNAFRPENKHNPIFIPIISLASPTDYLFTVFNRWGQVVFQTRDINEGWDGFTPKDRDAQEACYLYVVSVRDGGGTEIQKRGTVTLLRD